MMSTSHLAKLKFGMAQHTGQQFDEVTQQYYLRARFYNPVIGRFTQEDEYRGDGLNLYAYCGNNPVRYYDPSGYYCASKEDTFNSSYEERIAQTPKSNGHWEGKRGESKFILR